MERKRIIIYLSITFLLTYVYCFAVIYPLSKADNLGTMGTVIAQLAVSAVMFFPTIGVLLTRLITKEGFKNSWLPLNLKGNLSVYALAYFGPAVLTVLGAAVYFIVFPKAFDPQCGFMAETLAASGAGAETVPMPLWTILLIQGIQAFLFGPLINAVVCFGEEWGWRGYLLPKMNEQMKPLPMLLITGVIWGVWHAPLTAIGHNYGTGYAGFPFAGIGAMCGFCIVMGVFLSYITLKTKSCVPAILAHGGINSIASIGMYFTKDGGNPFVGPAPTGIIGALPFIAAAVVIYVRYFRRAHEA